MPAVSSYCQATIVDDFCTLAEDATPRASLIVGGKLDLAQDVAMGSFSGSNKAWYNLINPLS